MKAILLLLLLWGCSLQPEIQVEMRCVKFVKVDVWERFGGDLYCYHWIDDNKIEYIQYSSRLVVYKEGDCFPMLVKR